MNDEVIEQWVNQQKTGRRGASNTYSNTAIEFMVTIQSLFGLAGRKTEGFVESIFQLMDLDLPVPDHSTVSRRLLKLNIQLPVIPTNETIPYSSRLYRGESLRRR